MKNRKNYGRHRVALILALFGSVYGFSRMPDAVRLASGQAAGPGWSYTGVLNEARAFHTATLLPTGNVLVVGGHDHIYFPLSLNSTELYDPSTNTWTSKGTLNRARGEHTATLLPNGKVLVAGGVDCFSLFADCSFLRSTELYDPATGTWTYSGDLTTARQGHIAILLPNGKVLVAGGWDGGNLNFSSAELYDPTVGTWTPISGMAVGHWRPTVTVIASAKILVAGGNGTEPGKATAVSELYDPAIAAWSIAGNLSNPREGHAMTVLQNNRVLVAGPGSSAEVYEPSTSTWSYTGNLNTTRYLPTATRISDGKVLVVGGIDDVAIVNSAELYDTSTSTWSYTTHLDTARFAHTATLLPNGRVLVAGGADSDFATNTAELYEPGISSPPNQIDNAQFFVRQHYLDFLNREPDAPGLAFWTNEINLCGPDAGCIEAKRINVSAAFFLSIEFQQTGYLVYKSYKASYGNLPNAPVPLRLSEFLPDTQQIGQGVVVNQGGWEQVLENNKQAFTSGFVQRSRFTSAFPTSLTPTEFVDRLFANAGLTPSAADRTAVVNEFGSASNTADVAARSRALRRVAENSTLAQQEFNRAFVLMQYFGYLHRNPNDPPELTLDFQGYNFWLTKLNQHNGDYIGAEMVKAFIASGEYRQRFAP